MLTEQERQIESLKARIALLEHLLRNHRHPYEVSGVHNDGRRYPRETGTAKYEGE